MDQIEALRAAAGALIATAAMPVVVSVLRQLLDDVETPALTPAAAKPAAPKPPVSPSPTDSTWAELRQRLRAAKAERGIGNAELATAIGAAKVTVTKAVSANRSPTKAMRAKLELWLAEPAPAPEVAATAVAFRHNGANGRASSVHAGGSA